MLKNSDGIVLNRFVLDKYNQRVLKFNPGRQLEKGSLWKYTDLPAPDWSSSSYNDGGWSEAHPSSFPVIGSDVITRYYRTTVNLPSDLTGYSSCECLFIRAMVSWST